MNHGSPSCYLFITRLCMCDFEEIHRFVWPYVNVYFLNNRNWLRNDNSSKIQGRFLKLTVLEYFLSALNWYQWLCRLQINKDKYLIIYKTHITCFNIIFFLCVIFRYQEFWSQNLSICTNRSQGKVLCQPKMVFPCGGPLFYISILFSRLDDVIIFLKVHAKYS